MIGKNIKMKRKTRNVRAWKAMLITFFVAISFTGLAGQGRLHAQAIKLKITRAAVLDFELLSEKISADIVLMLVLEHSDKEIPEALLLLAVEIEDIRGKLIESKLLVKNREYEVLRIEWLEQLERLESDLTWEQQNLTDNLNKEKSSYLSENELTENENTGSDETSFSSRVYREIYKSMRQTALFKGFSIILDKRRSVLFADADSDITEDVFQELLKHKQKLYEEQ